MTTDLNVFKNEWKIKTSVELYYPFLNLGRMHKDKFALHCDMDIPLL